MTNPLLTSADREEALSRAYVDCVAAGAGYVVATMNFDRDGIDVEIRAGAPCGPASTSNSRPRSIWARRKAESSAFR